MWAISMRGFAGLARPLQLAEGNDGGDYTNALPDVPGLPGATRR